MELRHHRTPVGVQVYTAILQGWSRPCYTRNRQIRKSQSGTKGDKSEKVVVVTMCGVLAVCFVIPGHQGLHSDTFGRFAMHNLRFRFQRNGHSILCKNDLSNMNVLRLASLNQQVPTGVGSSHSWTNYSGRSNHRPARRIFALGSHL